AAGIPTLRRSGDDQPEALKILQDILAELLRGLFGPYHGHQHLLEIAAAWIRRRVTIQEAKRLWLGRRRDVLRGPKEEVLFLHDLLVVSLLFRQLQRAAFEVLVFVVQVFETFLFGLQLLLVMVEPATACQ